MISSLNVLINKQRQFSVSLAEGGELRDSEEARAVAIELGERISGSVSEIAESEFTGGICFIGKIEQLQAEIAKIMKKWAGYFQDCAQFQSAPFKAANSYAARRGITVVFHAAHPALPAPKKEIGKEREISLRTRKDDEALISYGGTGANQACVSEIKGLYMTHLYSELTKRGLGVTVRGKPSHIIKGLVSKTKTLLASLDAQDGEQRRILAETDRQDSKKYPSLAVELFSLQRQEQETPSVADDMLLQDPSSSPSPSTEEEFSAPSLDGDEFLKREELQAALSAAASRPWDVLTEWRQADARPDPGPVEEPVPILNFFA